MNRPSSEGKKGKESNVERRLSDALRLVAAQTSPRNSQGLERIMLELERRQGRLFDGAGYVRFGLPLWWQ